MSALKHMHTVAESALAAERGKGLCRVSRLQLSNSPFAQGGQYDSQPLAGNDWGAWRLRREDKHILL
jgi:hypothetical protein